MDNIPMTKDGYHRLESELRRLKSRERPDIIKVVPNLPLSASYRPSTTHLRDLGLPKPGRQTWHLDPESGTYHRLTAATVEALQGAAR